MGLVSFNNEKYEYFEDNDDFLFRADLTHDFLLNYVEKDISQLPVLFEQYITKKIDFRTFKLSKYQYCDEDFAEIKELLMPVHPYYEHEFRKVIINAIGDYFNGILAHLVYVKRSLNEKCIKKTWYTEKLEAIIKPFLQNGDTYLGDFYEEFYKEHCEGGYNIEEYFVPAPKEPPRGFAKELDTQNRIKRMLHWILNISFASLEKLSISQRVWLYRSIYEPSSTGTMSVTQRLSFTPPIRFGYDNERSDKTMRSQATYSGEIYSSLHGISDDVELDGIPSEMLSAFNRAVERAKKMSTGGINEQYKIDNLHQLLYLEILSMVRNDTSIRRCKNCGMYFVVTNRKIAYCERKFDGETRCSAIGSKRSFQNKLDTEYSLKIYNRAYKTHYARYKNEKLSWEDFSTWCNEAKTNLQKVRTGEMTDKDFEKWLKT